jgi:hypothetical protein
MVLGNPLEPSFHLADMSGSTTPSDTVSPRSNRFRDSVHRIPTPGTQVHRPKRYVGIRSFVIECNL